MSTSLDLETKIITIIIIISEVDIAEEGKGERMKEWETLRGSIEVAEYFVF